MGSLGQTLGNACSSLCHKYMRNHIFTLIHSKYMVSCFVSSWSSHFITRIKNVIVNSCCLRVCRRSRWEFTTMFSSSLKWELHTATLASRPACSLPSMPLWLETQKKEHRIFLFSSCTNTSRISRIKMRIRR